MPVSTVENERNGLTMRAAERHPIQMNTIDKIFMTRALDLASRGEGLVSPNPMVGAVIVKNSLIAGEGFHLYENLRHAESYALEKAGGSAHGATLYCSLEPCCHDGRTPPCTDAIIESGLARVVIAMADPDSRVNGKGIAQLAAAGIEVESGLCAEEAARQNECYLKHIRTGSPFLHLILPAPASGSWAPSPALLETLDRYDAVVLIESGVAGQAMVEHVVSQRKHRPVGVVLREEDVQGARAAATGSNTGLIRLSREEMTFSGLIRRLEASAMTSAAILSGAMMSEKEDVARVDKVTIVCNAGNGEQSNGGPSAAFNWRGRELTLYDSKAVAAAAAVEITGYPRRGEAGLLD